MNRRRPPAKRSMGALTQVQRARMRAPLIMIVCRDGDMCGPYPTMEAAHDDAVGPVFRGAVVVEFARTPARLKRLA